MIGQPRDEVEEIKSRIDLVALIGETVQLRGSGNTYKGLCPFHEETGPSFIVNRQSRRGGVGGNYKCFGCQESGDCFTWIQKTQSVDFVASKKILAERAGVQLRAVDPRKEAQRARLFEVMEIANRYFTSRLADDPAGQRFLQDRHISEDAVEAFELGVDPDDGGLGEHLRIAGVNAAEAIEAGVLIRSRDGRAFDPQRGRFIFPVRDEGGRLVTFSSRALDPNDRRPKYVNGSATPIFDKSTVLYGLYQGRRAIGRARSVVLVEGYVDVIGCHQAGFANVVATMGTAITPQHVRKLRSSADTIILALDPDAGGRGGMDRGKRVALADVLANNDRLELRSIDLPDGKDPDEIVYEDRERWSALVAAAPRLVDNEFERFAKLDTSDPGVKRRAADELAPFVLAMKHPADAHHYRTRLKQLLSLDDPTLEAIMRGVDISSLSTSGAPVKAVPAPMGSSPQSSEMRLLHTVLRYPEAYRTMVAAKEIPALEPGDIAHGGVRALLAQATALEAGVPDAAGAAALFGEDYGALFSAAYATRLPETMRGLGELAIAVRKAALRRARETALAAFESAIADDDTAAAEHADAEARTLLARTEAADKALARLLAQPDRGL